MGVLRSVTVSREMFGACSHAGRLQASHPRCPVPNHPFGVAPEAAYANDWVVGSGVDVDAGSEVDCAAGLTQRPADRGCGGPRCVEVVKAAQHGVAWKRRPSSGEEPCDVSAFFVNGEDRKSTRLNSSH